MLKAFYIDILDQREKKLYRLSDQIGCMSQANVDFLLKHNLEISPDIVEVCPNSVEPLAIEKNELQRVAIKENGVVKKSAVLKLTQII